MSIKLPPSFLTPSLLNSPSTRHRLWVYYTIASFGGIDKTPCQIQQHAPGPTLLKESIIFDGNITSDEINRVLFDVQCIVYSEPLINVKSILQSIKPSTGNISYLLKDLNISLLTSSSCCESKQLKDISEFVNLKDVFEKVLSTQKTFEDFIKLIELLDSLCLLLETCDWCDLIGREQWLIDVVFQKESKLHVILLTAANEDSSKTKK